MVPVPAMRNQPAGLSIEMFHPVIIISPSQAMAPILANPQTSTFPPGEAYVQIQSLSAWATGGGDDVGDFKRDTFYARLIPAKLARVQIARSPFYGGS